MSEEKAAVSMDLKARIFLVMQGGRVLNGTVIVEWIE
jgi:predicted peroxiredoxin